MVKRMIWWMVAVGTVVVALVWLGTPETCVACASQTPPPTCTANMSAMTVRQADDRRVWWDLFDRREPRTVNMYLGLNMNGGSTPLPYSYELIPSGDWQPAWITPITGTGTLSPGENNQTIQVTLPYSSTDRGDLNLTARIDSPCVFSPSDLASTVRINEQGPTVWPITSRTCPTAGEKPTFRFGLRNPDDQPQTYRVTARATTQFGGDHTPILAGAVEQNPQPRAGVYEFPEITLGPSESQELQITCETFGFCLTGSESRVELEVVPAPTNSVQFRPAIASSNVTLRDPSTDCSPPADWWFIMPPRVQMMLAGVPGVLGLSALAWYFWPQSTTGAGSDEGPAPRKNRRSDNPGRGVVKDEDDPDPLLGGKSSRWRK